MDDHSFDDGLTKGVGKHDLVTPAMIPPPQASREDALGR